MKQIYKSLFFLAASCFIGFSYSGAYFSSAVLISENSIATAKPLEPGRIVISEVYYDVSPDRGGEPNDEWIELYNSGDISVSIKDWTISDNGATRTIHSNISIAPHGVALVSKDHSVWNNYNTIPHDVTYIELGQNIGNGLSNSGDLLSIKDQNGNIIDQMSYGLNTSIFNPSCMDVEEGHSLERSPASHDNDLASDFINQNNPTPGAIL